MTDFSDLEHKLKTTYAPSPWLVWAEARQAARMEAYQSLTVWDGTVTSNERFPMTDDEKRAALALEKCTYLPGSFEKRFARDMAGIARGTAEITVKQRGWLWKQVHRYRRQIGDAELVRLAESLI